MRFLTYTSYSSAFYDQHMKEFQAPEILKTPLEDLLLQMRVLGIDNLDSFPFPTPPNQLAINSAISTLTNIAALTIPQEINPPRGRTILTVTELGRFIAKFPIGARFAKIIVVGFRSAALPPNLLCALVAVLTERSPLLPDRSTVRQDSDSDSSSDQSQNAQDTTPLSTHQSSDALAGLRGFGAYLHIRTQGKSYLKKTKSDNTQNRDLVRFCVKHSLHQPTLERCFSLSLQLCALCEQIFGDTSFDRTVYDMNTLTPPDRDLDMALRQVRYRY